MHQGWHTISLDELDRVARHAAPGPSTRHRLGLAGQDIRGVVVTCLTKLGDEALIPGEGDHIAVEIVRVEP